LENAEKIKGIEGAPNKASGLYEALRKDILTQGSYEKYHGGTLGELRIEDAEIYGLLKQEYTRVRKTIQLIAAENQCSRAVLAALGSVAQNKTTEGFAGARYHAGSEVVDDIETLAVARAKEAFGAKYANVQPHSGTAANQIVLTAILNPGDKILSLGLDQGGHLSHGAKVSFTGKFFEASHYYVNKDTFLLDYDHIRTRAMEFKPKLIICGATAYSRKIDFARFRSIADEVGAYLLADVSHISGLIMAGAHQSPINTAHFTTSSTYKPGGPRGGIILMGRDFEKPVTVANKQVPLCELIDKATFPGVQGTPYLNNIAAKAVFFKEAVGKDYTIRQHKIIKNAKSLSRAMSAFGYDILTSGTDNHMVLINVANFRDGLTGSIAQDALEECGIIVNRNKLPYDKLGLQVTSGMRLGTPIVTKNAMSEQQMGRIATLIDAVLRGVEITDDNSYRLSETLKDEVTTEVEKLCDQFPMC
jgi:glycine hydroxymethyltransferase